MRCSRCSKQLFNFITRDVGTFQSTGRGISVSNNINSAYGHASHRGFSQLPVSSYPRQPAAVSKKQVDRRIASESVDAAKAQNKKGNPWQVQVNALKKKFTSGWQPRKRLSPDAIEGIRALHTRDPHQNSTPVLAEHFQVSPEAIRRILKSKWRPNEEEQESRRERWARRGQQIWSDMAEKGIKPPRRWQATRHRDTEGAGYRGNPTTGQSERFTGGRGDVDEIPFEKDMM